MSGFISPWDWRCVHFGWSCSLRVKEPGSPECAVEQTHGLTAFTSCVHTQLFNAFYRPILPAFIYLC